MGVDAGGVGESEGLLVEGFPNEGISTWEALRSARSLSVTISV